MESFCANCGAKILDGYKVCGNCGTPVGQSAANNAPAAAPATSFNSQPAAAPATTFIPQPTAAPATSFNPQPAAANKPPIALIGAAAAAIILIIAIIAGVSGNGYKKPLKNMAKAFEDGDFDLFESAYSDVYYEALDDILSDYDFDIDFSKGIKNIFEARVDYLEDECGKDYKVKVDFIEKEKYTGKEIDEFFDDYEDEEGIDYNDEEVKKLYEVEFVITAEGDDGDEDVLEGTAYIVKTDAGWGILSFEDAEWCEYEKK